MTSHSFRYLGSVAALDEHAELLAKWSLKDTLRAYKFAFTGKFLQYQAADFLKELFADEGVGSHVEILTNVHGEWAPLRAAGTDKMEKIAFAEVNASALSMEFFDKMYECGVLRENGAIKGCLPEYLEDGMEIHSEMAKLLLMEESENYNVFTPQERSEFLFRLFKLMAVGGPLNQYEDSVGPYFDIVKDLYKGCVSVGRNAATKAVHVVSHCYDVSALGSDVGLFPGQPHMQNVCFVCVSPTKKNVTILYNAWCGD